MATLLVDGITLLGNLATNDHIKAVVVLIQVPSCPKSWVCNPKTKNNDKMARPKKNLACNL
jgi:hypothetical protein